MDINTKVGANLMRIRKDSNINQEYLAGAIGLTRTSIVNIEKGRQSLTVENLLKACAILKCSVLDILPPTPTAKIKKEVVKSKVIKYKTISANFKW